MQMPGRKLSGGYRYGFGGYEKDDEIKGSGNHLSFNDFGYDPRTGRRWTIDEHTFKYPSISPYAYCNNNPIIYNDPDGKDWTIKTTSDNNGNQTVQIKLTAAVLNASSNKAINMGDFANAVKNQVQTSYSIKYTKTIYEPVTIKSGLDNYPSKTIMVPREVTVTVNVSVDVRVINKQSELKSNEHLVRIQDSKNLPGVYGKANEIGGTIVDVGDKFVPNMLNGKDNNTLPHELGHTLGLRHIDQKSETFMDWFGGNPQYMTPANQKKNATNAMFSGGSPYMNDKTSTGITGSQIETGKKAAAAGDINKH
jgi:RHS repeat-associated protein